VASRWNPQGEAEEGGQGTSGNCSNGGEDERGRFQLTTVRETFTRQRGMVRLLEGPMPLRNERI